MRTAETIEANKVQAETSTQVPANKPKATPAELTARIAKWQWPKGFCPNPSGRPKRDRASEIAQEVFEKNPEAVYAAMAKALLKGNAYAFSQLADRGYGKLKEKLELSGTDEIAKALESARKRSKK